MKQHQFLMVVALLTTIMCGSAVGEYQDDRLFGNGRFLKKLRDDITGRNQQSSQPKQSAKPKKADPRTRRAAPTPAKRPSAKTPTPAIRPGQAPTPAVRPTNRSVPAAKGQTNRRPSNAPVAAEKKEVQASGKKQTNGFGMLIVTQGDNLVVTKVDPRGNAREAGIKPGDLVLDAGGAEISSIEEFNEIANILGNGDQLEFEITRRGQKKKILVQFGTAPEEDEIVERKTPKENDYSFVPQGDDTSVKGLRSVLEQPPNGNNTSLPPVRTTQRPVQTRYAHSNIQQTVEQQRRQIEQMQQEIHRLRQQTNVAPPTGRIQLGGPSLSGPGK